MSDRWALVEFQRPVAPDYHPGPNWPSLGEPDFLETLSVVQERWMMLAIPWDLLVQGMDTHSWRASLTDAAVLEATRVCHHYTGSDPTAVFLNYDDYKRMARYEGVLVIT